MWNIPHPHPQFSTLTSQLASRAYKVVPVFFFKSPYYNFQYIYIYADVNEMSFLGFTFFLKYLYVLCA